MVDERQFSDVALRIPKDEKGKPSVAPGALWYVYYYFRNPETGKMQKFMDTCKINRYKTVAERKKAGMAWVDAYRLLLHSGFNPFDKEGIVTQIDEIEPFTLRSGLEHAYEAKSGLLKTTTADDYESRMNVFLAWAKDQKLDDKDIRYFKELHAIAFINYLVSRKGRKVGRTSQDNYKRCLSALFGKLYKDKIIDRNPFEAVETKAGKPVKNRPFTPEQVQEIRQWLLKNDPQLYDYVLHIYYGFLRVVEVVRLRAMDYNLSGGYLTTETKTDAMKVKKIIGPIRDFLQRINVNSIPGKAHIFTDTGEFKVWDVPEKVKTDHFNLRFRKLKAALGLGKEYGMYSFRHTAALEIYHSYIRDGKTEHGAVLELMPIIGHTNPDTTRKYLRDIGGMLPKDYGHRYTINL